MNRIQTGDEAIRETLERLEAKVDDIGMAIMGGALEGLAPYKATQRAVPPCDPMELDEVVTATTYPLPNLAENCDDCFNDRDCNRRHTQPAAPTLARCTASRAGRQCIMNGPHPAHWTEDGVRWHDQPAAPTSGAGEAQCPATTPGTDGGRWDAVYACQLKVDHAGPHEWPSEAPEPQATSGAGEALTESFLQRLSDDEQQRDGAVRQTITFSDGYPVVGEPVRHGALGIAMTLLASAGIDLDTDPREVRDNASRAEATRIALMDDNARLRLAAERERNYANECLAKLHDLKLAPQDVTAAVDDEPTALAWTPNFHQDDAAVTAAVEAPTKRHDLDLALRKVLNRHSAENGSNTPDFILAEYLEQCLTTFDRFVNRRSDWYGRRDYPGQPAPAQPATVGERKLAPGWSTGDGRTMGACYACDERVVIAYWCHRDGLVVQCCRGDAEAMGVFATPEAAPVSDAPAGYRVVGRSGPTFTPRLGEWVRYAFWSTGERAGADLPRRWGMPYAFRDSNEDNRQWDAGCYERLEPIAIPPAPIARLQTAVKAMNDVPGLTTEQVMGIVDGTLAVTATPPAEPPLIPVATQFAHEVARTEREAAEPPRIVHGRSCKCAHKLMCEDAEEAENKARRAAEPPRCRPWCCAETNLLRPSNPCTPECRDAGRSLRPSKETP